MARLELVDRYEEDIMFFAHFPIYISTYLLLCFGFVHMPHTPCSLLPPPPPNNTLLKGFQRQINMSLELLLPSLHMLLWHAGLVQQANWSRAYLPNESHEVEEEEEEEWVVREGVREWGREAGGTYTNELLAVQQEIWYIMGKSFDFLPN